MLEDQSLPFSDKTRSRLPDTPETGVNIPLPINRDVIRDQTTFSFQREGSFKGREF